MALSLTHRTLLRRAAMAAALGALLAPAPAAASTTSVATAAKAKVATPVISSARPMRLAVGDTLAIRGRNFKRGRGVNTVVFQAPGGKAVFVKAGIGTKKLIKVTLPDRLESQLAVRGGFRVATRFKLRVLSARFGKRFTRPSSSPLIAPKPAPAVGPDGASLGSDGSGVEPGPPPLAPVDVDSDRDGVLNSADADDDDDLLSDAAELAINEKLGDAEGIRMDTLNADSDGDEVSDGFEYGSARDLNSSYHMPYPGRRPYANPLLKDDAGTDFDGDGLTLAAEYRLWRYQLERTGETASLDTLSYSDGIQYSVYTRDGVGRRIPALVADGYERQADFQAWLGASGYGEVWIPRVDGPLALLDVNRDGAVSTTRRLGYPAAEDDYLDIDDNGMLSDDERDEDADGLSNADETEGETLRFRLDSGYWAALYPKEGPFPIIYKGTEFDDPDSDGDGIRDGADDQDFDDVPNIMELSRWAATGRLDARDADNATARPTPAFGRVNPFNPCLPDRYSRTCPRYVPFEGAWAPFDESPDYFSFR